MIKISSNFADFDQFTEAAAAWDIDFRQTGKGKLNASLMQLVSENWSVSKARFDQASYQSGVAVPSMRTFAFLGSSAPEVSWCNRSFVPGTLAVFASSGEFKSIAPPGFDVYTVSFSENQLELACERLGIAGMADKLPSIDAMFQRDPLQTEMMGQFLNRCLRQKFVLPNPANPIDTSNHVRDKICEKLVLLLSGGTPIRRTPKQKAQLRAFSRALEVIDGNLSSNLSVPEIANSAGMSRRSLEYTFRDRMGVGPKAYVIAQRLIQVRRDIKSTRGSITITDIANRWGFWHMGQFAKDYKLQFGELPSQTLAEANPLRRGHGEGVT